MFVVLFIIPFVLTLIYLLYRRILTNGVPQWAADHYRLDISIGKLHKADFIAMSKEQRLKMQDYLKRTMLTAAVMNWVVALVGIVLSGGRSLLFLPAVMAVQAGIMIIFLLPLFRAAEGMKQELLERSARLRRNSDSEK